MIVKLNSNESPFGPSPKAIAAVKASATAANFYPDNDARQLRQKLAERHDIELAQVLVGAGSSDLIAIICRTLLKPGLNAVTSQRSFIVYSMATEAAGARLMETPMLDDGFDLEAISAAINPQTRIVFLSNPNNPTGTLFDAAALDRFLTKVSERVTVVIDEAYYDYAQYFAKARGIEYSHSLDYIREARKVIILRTFSKAHGLAGLRVGCAFGPPELLKSLARARTTFSISTPAQAGALAALDDQSHLAGVLQNNAEGTKWLFNELSQLGYLPVPTWANFLYCDLREDAYPLCKRVEEQGVLIRPLGPWGAPNAIRVTIGTPHQNQQFLAAFKKARLGSVPA